VAFSIAEEAGGKTPERANGTLYARIARSFDEPLAVQLKPRPTVDWGRYGGQSLWLLFPNPSESRCVRKWFLVPHDEFYQWVKKRHGHAPKWSDAWSYPTISKDLGRFLGRFAVAAL
jgi:hypothetical protein